MRRAGAELPPTVRAVASGPAAAHREPVPPVGLIAMDVRRAAPHLDRLLRRAAAHDRALGQPDPAHPTAPMFTNSGMMQFVPYFLGEEPVPFDPPRVVDIQKCVRAGGKHNDLDAIGRTPPPPQLLRDARQLELRRLLQAEAISWAWELVPRCCGSTPIACGSPSTSATTRPRRSGRRDRVPAERIQRLDKDNFWEMGDTGPCGPSSEIFWDYGPELRSRQRPRGPGGGERYVEIWNLVFMQFFRRPDGALQRRCRSRNVDTGAGLERILAVGQGRRTRSSTPTSSRRSSTTAQSITGKALRAGRPHRHRAADHGRPHPHDDLPGERRCRPVERGPGLRAAPHHPPRRALRLPARRRRAA